MDDNEIVNASLTLSEDLLKDVDRRCKELDITRSQYFRMLARNEIATAKQAEAEEEARQPKRKKAA